MFQARNLYVHFPFCRRKCTYCVLHSRCGVSDEARAAYVGRLARTLGAMRNSGAAPLATVYFGGGSPALCDLEPLAEPLRGLLDAQTEFTVELHPLDVTERNLCALKELGVNRISMGVQSTDDAMLADMGRGYTFAEAERAFALVRRYFDNAGIDLIVGYPGRRLKLERLKDWGLSHCSVYSLQLEEGSILAHRIKKSDAAELPSDDETLDQVRETAAFLATIGLNRYEISNYALPGLECRHNFAVWRGEDYLGLGEGACGRLGRMRTRDVVELSELSGGTSEKVEVVSPEFDEKERRLFRLRTREGLETSEFEEWRPILDGFVKEGLVTRNRTVYTLTPRGMEVCDSILADLV